ncbi:MAG: hypothetical protein NC820_07090, partial [Candidatus Omnitrophica bacterium]|nr:hypothetical protein [Candidatus Omnitrophota bacterium]
LTNCRVLQYKQVGLQSYSATHSNHSIYFSGNIVINISDINGYLEKLQDEFVLSNGKTRLVFNHGQCTILYNGLPLTKANHVNSSIYINGKQYHSNSAYWQVKKEASDKLVARGIWHSLPIEQIWEIKINKENSFLWKINLQINESVDIEEQSVYFTFHQDYRYWFSEYSQGSFPAYFLENVTDMVQRCIQDGTVGLYDINNQFPTISIRFSKELSNFVKIFNSDFYNKARILRVDRVEPEDKVKFAPGNYFCFEIELSIDESKEIELEDSLNTLQAERLKFIFDNGRGRIFWDNSELTKKLGLYTSLRSLGRWYDSLSSAVWKIKGRDDNKIMAVGRWLYLPVSQYWEIKLNGDGSIEFNVDMMVDRKIEFDRLQTNIMLSEKYKEWFVGNETGYFPHFKGDIDDDWEKIWTDSKSKNIDCIGVLKCEVDGKCLPKITFLPKGLESKWSLNIVNSDLYHRGRVLQYLNNKKIILMPGQYHYFSGRIIIDT